MRAANWQSSFQALLAGMVLALAVDAAQAAPLTEFAPHPKSEKTAKGKALHFIEKRPVARSKVREKPNKTEIPMLAPEQLPASEPSLLELKGVRG
ncbi:MAG: hypothetical protein KKA63_06660 [Gammaproteobacteria bacterium]|nr:hypothetical protein [Gammaproteobacteria bacterium]MDD2929840.1 hypothetical protein [Sideroxydans sp.]MDD5471219.1 hypothetical protein [Sideroxydans sp.]